MNEHFSFKRFIIALLVGLGGAAAAFFVPSLAMHFYTAVVFFGVCWGISYAATAFFLTLIGLVFANTGYPVLLYSQVFMFVCASAWATFGFKKKLPYRSIALVLALLFLLGLYAQYSLPSLLADKPPYTGIVETLRAIMNASREQGLPVEDMEELITSVPEIFYGILILFAEALAFFGVLFTKLLCSFSNADVRAMAPFPDWQLPSSLKIGIPVIAGCILILHLLNFNGSATLGFTAAYMLIPLFAVMGLCFVRFIGARMPQLPKFFFMLLFIWLLVSPMLAVMIGLIDYFAGIRRRMLRVDGLIKQAFEKAEREKSDVVEVDLGDGRGKRIIARRKDSSVGGPSQTLDENGGVDGANTENNETADNTDNTENTENNENSDDTDKNNY